MEKAVLYVVFCIGTLICLTDIKGCSDCWSAGGTPVKGVVMHACMPHPR